MLRLIIVSAVALLAAGVAGQTTPSDDEFSMLNIPRPGALFGSGFGIPLNLGQLMTAMKDEEKERPPATRVHVIHLPPALAGLFRRMGQPKEEAAARPIMTMRFGPIAMPMPSTNMQGTAVSRPLEQLRTLASNCLPCSQVQSRMRSISIMHGPDGQTVKTTTEVFFGVAVQTFLNCCLAAATAAAAVAATAVSAAEFLICRLARTARSTLRARYRLRTSRRRVRASMETTSSTPSWRRSWAACPTSSALCRMQSLSPRSPRLPRWRRPRS